MKRIISRLTMKPHSFGFIDYVDNAYIYRYKDKYGDLYFAKYPFKFWNYRIKL
jgi:hypothetical protein